jgi:hypothetical protein
LKPAPELDFRAVQINEQGAELGCLKQGVTGIRTIRVENGDAGWIDCWMSHVNEDLLLLDVEWSAARQTP